MGAKKSSSFWNGLDKCYGNNSIKSQAILEK